MENLWAVLKVVGWLLFWVGLASGIAFVVVGWVIRKAKEERERQTLIYVDFTNMRRYKK